MKEKKKKEKITYIDDGRSLADMSGVSGGMHFSKQNTVSSFKAQWDTFWGAVKMMLLPTLVMVGFLLVVFLIMTVIFGAM
ncbi:MAG: hypothetical protein IJZ23_05305 [Roseburia sp.]|nr:hypothetical protein [Roseburia sp.]